jgi:hypothetical protein
MMGERYDCSTGVTYVTKTKVELAKEAKDIALQNLVNAAESLGKAQRRYLAAQQAEMAPCVCTPRQCTNCGGKK